MHPSAPVPLYVPAGQVAQLFAPAALNVPAEQGVGTAVD